ncbi:hypothetical protein Lalb_Chr20g0116421 [Lupinus albus]|uniref:Cellulose synthase (UDP-forming) n=1 Tax=Lupinus albus TaxID=3870 RepID=A0A6A4NP22_LUPAL|nr:hypothetical protein Lalb_Chr20g0116421 [Lupinus albus]
MRLALLGETVELHGADGYGGPLYIGTCCFHRRDALCGKKYNGRFMNDWKSEIEHVMETNLQELEEQSKALACCTYEENTLWGKEVDNLLSISYNTSY